MWLAQLNSSVLPHLAKMKFEQLFLLPLFMLSLGILIVFLFLGITVLHDEARFAPYAYVEGRGCSFPFRSNLFPMEAFQIT